MQCHQGYSACTARCSLVLVGPTRCIIPTVTAVRYSALGIVRFSQHRHILHTLLFARPARLRWAQQTAAMTAALQGRPSAQVPSAAVPRGPCAGQPPP